jgi:hypothetical protein
VLRLRRLFLNGLGRNLTPARWLAVGLQHTGVRCIGGGPAHPSLHAGAVGGNHGDSLNSHLTRRAILFCGAIPRIGMESQNMMAVSVHDSALAQGVLETLVPVAVWICIITLCFPPTRPSWVGLGWTASGLGLVWFVAHILWGPPTCPNLPPAAPRTHRCTRVLLVGIMAIA